MNIGSSVVGPAPGGMRQQMLNPDLLHAIRISAAVVVPESAVTPEDEVVQLKSALFDQREGRDRGNSVC